MFFENCLLSSGFDLQSSQSLLVSVLGAQILLINALYYLIFLVFKLVRITVQTKLLEAMHFATSNVIY